MIKVKLHTYLVKRVMCFIFMVSILNTGMALDGNNHAKIFPVESNFLDHIDSSPQSLPLPLESIQEFVRVFERIRSHYVKEYSDKELFQIAMEGMLRNLDPYSTYLNKEDTQLLYDSSIGNTISIGVNITASKDYVRVVTPFDDSPAAKVGIKAGDFIVKVNEVNVKGMMPKNVYALLNGQLGSKVDLTVIRGDKLYKFTMDRAAINIKPVDSKMINDDIGYIRIRAFQNTTPKSLLEQLSDLKNKGAKALILDLRNNPGGVLQAGVATADAFLQEGIIVRVTGRDVKSNITYSATQPDPSSGLPTVVLINVGTASTAEFVAAALQENDRAVILGQTSFGKGVVQSVFALGEDRSILLTSGSFNTPDNNPIEKIGVTPDYEFIKSASRRTAISQASALLQKKI